MKVGRPQLNKNELEVVIAHKGLSLQGILCVPNNAQGLVIFAHGSGSSRWSTRNNFVARELQKSQMATLLMDLLTEEEELERANVFDINLLAQRLLLARDWLSEQDLTHKLKIGYFGASTGAGAALVAAARRPQNIFAVVSRGGRADMAAGELAHVQAPTLLIVGGEDDVVITLNQQAFKQLRCEKKLEIIPRATHLFEEPGTLEEVASLAAQWFKSHVTSSLRSAETSP